MKTDITIDGSLGEGGGQVLRSSLALSILTGKSLTLKNIRAGRPQPGLKRQHLACVQAAARISNACVSPVELGTTSLTFEPQAVQPGQYRFSIGSAGSTTLVLQTVLPPLLVAGGSSCITVEGGTHNEWAPPFDFLDLAYLPLIRRMGPDVFLSLERYGFYPVGGGQIQLDIEPVERLKGFHLMRRGELIGQRVEAVVSKLSKDIAQRELDTFLRQVDWSPSTSKILPVASFGPGNVLCASIESRELTEVFTACGRQGLPAEKVAKQVANEVQSYLKLNVPVGPHLADQLLLPLGISAWQGTIGDPQAGGSFRTGPLTLHSTTHIDILQQFLGIQILVEQETDQVCLVHVLPAS